MFTKLSMFKTRHVHRDRAEDAERLKRLKTAFAEIINDMERETAGLSARLGAVSAAASALYEDADAVDRDKRLTESEHELVRAATRVRTLERRLDELRKLRDGVELCFAVPQEDTVDPT